MNKNDLNNKLRQLRFLHGELSQQRLAELCGVSRQTIHAVEKGTFNPSVRLALKMAAVFDCPVEAIFSLPAKNGEEK